MKIYNTLTRKKEEFVPIEEGKVRMYVCGPTVYNYFHIGNARPFVVFDTMRKYLEYRGYKVKFVQNFTDVDDKIIKRAKEEGISAQEVSEKYIAEYFKDAAALNVKKATVHPQVTKTMDDIIKFVQDLIDLGYAYESDGDVYYRARKFKGYGKLSGKNIDDLISGARIAVDEKKEDPLDFALWKARKEESEIAWESPWGMGRPGWHIECSAMSKKYLGDTIDIHAGGQDLQFPHHENEIAQSEAHSGKAFAHYWMHNGYINIDGIKMSKSLGNGIDPLEVIDKYGADALRFFLATGNTPGNDMRYSDKRVEACANFANKLWNASRYVHMNIDDHDVKNELPKTLTTEDKWIVSTLNTVAKEVNENLEKFELGIAVQKIYEFIWDCYCDWYIELVKTRLSSDGEDAQNARQVLLYVLDQILRLLHPFMPYITEEIWQTIPHEGETVMLAKYPEYNAELDYPEASDEMKKIMAAIRAIRNRRAEMNVPPSRKAKVYVATKFADTFRDGTQFIQKLASASEVEVAESFEIEGAVNIVTADAKIYIPMDELVDREKELARLNKELEQVKKRLAQSEGKLNNQGFVAKAPEAVIEKVKGQAAKEREQIALIEAAIAALK